MKKYYWLIMTLGVWGLGCGDDGNSPAPPAPDPDPDVSPYENCLPTVGSNTLEMATWNIENFPMTTSAAEMVEEIIEDTDLDLIALQEITTQAALDGLLDSLSGWEGVLGSGTNQKIGYLYKTAEITVVEAASEIYSERNTEYNNAFTSVRRPVHIRVRHTGGLEVDLINVHLKCCGGSENEDRRREASRLLKLYVDDSLSNENVIIIGDFNDEIVDTENVFQNFIDDPDNYRFSTMSIAEGASSNWSFPSFPSQIDQILITNELFDNEAEVSTLTLDNCESTYSNQVSDHRPVMIRLNAD